MPAFPPSVRFLTPSRDARARLNPIQGVRLVGEPRLTAGQERIDLLFFQAQHAERLVWLRRL